MRTGCTPCLGHLPSSTRLHGHLGGLLSCLLHGRGRFRGCPLLATRRLTRSKWSGTTTAAYRGQYRDAYRREREAAQRAPLRSSYRQRRPAPQQRLPPPPEEPILSSQQVVDKQVITRTTGVNLGIISHLYTDPDLLRIVSANLRPKGLSLGRISNGNLVWETVCQVGDVVLVHDESALDFAPQDEAVGFIDLMGCSVRTSRGEQLGKVREYTFSPESGRVDLIKFDALGWRSVPESLIGVWQVGVEFIDLVEERDIFLLPQAENAVVRLSDGPLEAALLQLQKLFQSVGDDEDSYADGGVVDAGYQQWLAVHGADWEAAYGTPPPPNRRELDMFMQGTQATTGQRGNASPPRRTVRSLPPGRTASVSERLEPARERVYERVSERRPASRAREAVASRQDPRAKRRPAGDPPAQATNNRYQSARDDLGYPPAEAVNTRYPSAREDISYRPAQADVGYRQAQPDEGYRQPPAQRSSTVASIPIIEPRQRVAPYDQDADGNFGDRQEPAQPSGKPFNDWVERSPAQQRQRKAVLQESSQGYVRAPAVVSAGDDSGDSWSRSQDVALEPEPAWDPENTRGGIAGSASSQEAVFGKSQNSASQSDRLSKERGRQYSNQPSRNGSEAASNVANGAQTSSGSGQADRGQRYLREEEGNSAVVRESEASRLGQE